jgi:hypothetical protein
LHIQNRFPGGHRTREVTARGLDGPANRIFDTGKKVRARLRGFAEAVKRKDWTRHSGLRIASASPVEVSRYSSPQPHFLDGTDRAGIGFLNRYYPGFLNQPLTSGMIRPGPGGIAAVDYDDDGYYDLFIPDGVASKLFRNSRDGPFKDVTAKAGLSELDGVSIPAFADYDNDGYKDLFVSRTFRHNQLVHNNGDGTFTDVTAQPAIGQDSCTTVASWADCDNDGYLDLYVGRYMDLRTCVPTTLYARNSEPNQLYHNNGTFTDVTVASGTLAYGAGMSASFADYDNNSKLDIYVTHIPSDEAWMIRPPDAAAVHVEFCATGCMENGSISRLQPRLAALHLE